MNFSPEKELHKKLVGLFQSYQKVHDFIFFHVRNEMGKDRYDPYSLGVLAGVADFCILMQNKVIFLEIKSEKGRLSDDQKDFLIKANRLGHLGLVAFGWNDILDKVDALLLGNNKRADKATDYGSSAGKIVWLDKMGKASKKRGTGKVSVFLY